MKVVSGRNLGLSREYSKKLFGLMFYSCFTCSLTFTGASYNPKVNPFMPGDLLDESRLDRISFGNNFGMRDIGTQITFHRSFPEVNTFMPGDLLDESRLDQIYF